MKLAQILCVQLRCHLCKTQFLEKSFEECSVVRFKKLFLAIRGSYFYFFKFVVRKKQR